MPRRNKVPRRQPKSNAKTHKPLHQAQQQAARKRPMNDAQQSFSQKKKKKHVQQQQQQQQQHDRPTIPFRPGDRILLIGEGDLSFAASIIRHHGCRNVTATVLERDHGELLGKYPSVDGNIEVIERRPAKADEAAEPGSEKDEDDDDEACEEDDDGEEEEEEEKVISNKLIYNVDATKLPSSIARSAYDHIIFNFPHVGGKSTDINRQVRHNQQLLVSFFQRALSLPSTPSSASASASSSSSGAAGSNAYAPLARNGTITVTLFESEPYTLWNIRDLARHAGLQVQRSFRFRADAYPGYKHARTLGAIKSRRTGGEDGGGWRGEDRPARSYVFVRKGEGEGEGEGRKRKRKRGDDDDESSEED